MQGLEVGCQFDSDFIKTHLRVLFDFGYMTDNKAWRETGTVA
jgi:hypothetical protein